MTKILAGIAAVTLIGVAAFPLSASAGERKSGISNDQVTDISARHRGWRHHRHYGHRHFSHRYYAPRRHFGPRYGYYGYPHAYGYPAYGYYRPAPFVSFGAGPFGFRVF